MISKHELLTKMPGYISTEKMLAEIEGYMIAAAEQGKHNIIYHFPDGATKEALDGVYMVLGREEYNTQGGYDAITIKW